MPRRLTCATMFAAGFVVFPMTAHSVPTDPSWIPRAAMSMARDRHAAVAVGGTLYVMGGLGIGGVTGTTLVEAYDPATNTWTTKAPMLPNYSSNLAVRIGGQIYVVLTATSFGRVVAAYDPATDAWVTKSTSAEVAGARAAAAIGGTIYVMGGTGSIKAVEAYDTATNTWTPKASMLAVRSNFAAVTMGGTIYAIGGLIGPSGPVNNSVEAYDAATDTWTMKAVLPETRYALAAAVIGGSIYAVGGYATQNTVEAYDPATDSWTTLAPMPTGRFDLAAAVIGETLYVVGGRDPSLGMAVAANEAARAGASLTVTGTASLGTPSVGQWMILSVVVKNSGRIDASGISASILATSGGGLMAYESGPIPSGTLTLAPGTSTTFQWTYSVSGAGSYSFTITVSGTDAAAGGLVLAASTLSGTTNAASRLISAIARDVWPVPVGQWTRVRLTVTNAGGVAAVAVTPSVQVTAGAGLVTYELGPVPAGPFTMGPGTSTTFVWTYSISGAGTVSLTASVEGSDSGTGNPVFATSSLTGTVSTASALASVSTLPTWVAVGRWIRMSMTVTNVGGLNDVNGVVPTLLINNGSALVVLESGPVPPGPENLGPGSSTTFVWTFSVSGAGYLAMTVSATGIDAGSGSAVSATSGNSALLLVPSAATPSATCGAVSGLIGTIAGTGAPGFNGDGIAATTAKLNYPEGVAVDGQGNVVIADSLNNMVRRIDAASGVISRIAGTGVKGSLGDGGSAFTAQLDGPTSVAVNAAGDVFMTTGGGLRMVDAATGRIATLVTPIAGGALALDVSGNVYYVAGNGSVMKLNMATGVSTTIAGTGGPGYNGDGIAATSAQVNNPQGLAIDGAGNVFIADTYNYRVRRVDAGTGQISTVAGTGSNGYNGDGVAVSSQVSTPWGLAADAAGDLLITEPYANRVRQVNAGTGLISTVVGTGIAGFSGDGGPATSAQVYTVWEVAWDGNCRMYFADSNNHRVRAVPSGATTDDSGVAIPPELFKNLPPIGTIQVRHNIIRTEQASVAWVVARGKSGGTVNLTLVDPSGSVLGTLAPITLDANGVGVAPFNGSLSGKMRLRTGYYWIVASGGVSDKKQIMVIGLQ